MNKDNNKVIISIDMGGTTGKVAISNLKGEILKKFIVKTKYKDEIIPSYNQDIRNKCKEFDIDWEKDVVAVGCGTPGNLDITNSTVINSGNLGWFDYPIRKTYEKYMKKPMFFINDARAIIYAEWKRGAGKNYTHFLTLSIGTGVGGGLVIDNKIVKGARNLAGEYAHSGRFQNKYDCTCGLKYCMEAMSSATGIEREFQVYIKKHPNSPLAKLQRKTNHNITIKNASSLIHAKDKGSISVLSKSLRPLVATISYLATALDLEAVLIGGGPSALGEILIDIIRKELRPLVWKYTYDSLDVKLCELKNDAGIIGVLLYTLDNLKNN